MNIAIIGTGYVGLVTGLCLASRGHAVTCVDKDAEKVRRLASGEPTIFEKGVPELLKRELGKHFSVTQDLARAVAHAEAIMICVDTPFDSARGHINLRSVETAAEQVGSVL